MGFYILCLTYILAISFTHPHSLQTLILQSPFFKSHQNQLFRHQFYTRVIYQFGNDKIKKRETVKEYSSTVKTTLVHCPFSCKHTYSVQAYAEYFTLVITFLWSFTVCVISDLLFTSIMIWIPLCLHFPSLNIPFDIWLFFFKSQFWISFRACKFPQECRFLLFTAQKRLEEREKTKFFGRSYYTDIVSMTQISTLKRFFEGKIIFVW
jgi:hypothetical protein